MTEEEAVDQINEANLEIYLKQLRWAVRITELTLLAVKDLPEERQKHILESLSYRFDALAVAPKLILNAKDKKDWIDGEKRG